MTRERFGFRTIGIPVAAVAGFYIIQIIVMLIYTIIYSFIASVSGQFTGTDILADIRNTLMQQSNNMGAVYSVVIALAALFVIYILLKGNPLAVRREKTSLGAILSSVIIMIGVSGYISLQMMGLTALGETVPFIEKVLKDYTDLSQAFVGDGNMIMIILSTCILVPIAEELVFRGIIQGELRRVFPAWATILIQAVIFALVHGNIVQISYVIFPALVLGLVYEWTKSLYVPIALHMIFNFIGSALPEMLGQNDAAVLYLYVVQIAFIPAAIIGIFYLRSRRRMDPAMAAEQGLQVLQPVSATLDSYNGEGSGLDSINASEDADAESRAYTAGNTDSAGTADATDDGAANPDAMDDGAANPDAASRMEQGPQWIHRDS